MTKIGTVISHDGDNTPTGQLAKNYGLPHQIANLLIGKREEETLDNIEVFEEWVKELKRNWLKKEHRRKIERVGRTFKIKVSQKGQELSLVNCKYGYGKTAQGELFQVESEQRVIRLILMLRIREWTYTRIVKELHARRIRTRFGLIHWDISTVNMIIRNNEHQIEDIKKCKQRLKIYSEKGEDSE